MPETFTPSTMREILRVFFTRWLGILTIFVIIAGVTLAATLRAPKWYRSRISFQTTRPRPINPLASPQNPFLPTEVFLRTQQAIILSDDVVSRALARLDGVKTPDSIINAAQIIRQTEQERLIDQIKHIKVTTPIGENFANSEIFYINVEFAEDPRQAKKLAEAIAKEYRAKFDALQKLPLSQSTAILKAELSVLKARLDDANKALANFISTDLKGDLVAFRSIASAATPLSVAAGATTLDKEIKALQADLSEKDALKAEIDKEFTRVAKLSDLDPLDTDNIPVIPERLLKDNPPVLALAQKLTDLRLKAIELQPRYTTDFRQRQNIAQEIRDTSTLLVDNLSRVSTALEQDIAASRARLSNLQQTFDELQVYMRQLSSNYVNYSRLKDDIQHAQGDYEAKKDELKRAQTAESVAEEQVFLSQLDTASLPDKPIRPILWINTTVGALVALLLALAYAFIADYFDHRFKTVEQAEKYLDLPVLGSVQNLGRGIIVRK
ncbi:MAG: hypothetical protein KAT11_02925 [Phycisphaerae bacterium]|nr:hypothetical protein [Phycisphaerae bacterium]